MTSRQNSNNAVARTTAKAIVPPTGDRPATFRPGAVLLITVVLLVILSTIGYTVTCKVMSRSHRDRYLIDYQLAKYACDSGVKYALAKVQDFSFAPISRPNEPDFSDLFAMDGEQYEQLLAEWELLPDQESQNSGFDDIYAQKGSPNDLQVAEEEVFDINSIVVRGPYGPAWPLVTESLEFEVGPAKVKIEIEDENAKYPLGWAVLADKKIKREISVGLESFCEWMGMDGTDIDDLKADLKEVAELKKFSLNFKPIMKRETVRRKLNRRSRGRSRRGRGARNVTVKRTVAAASVHTADFARIFHSALIDTEALARPNPATGGRKESSLKYMGMWGSDKININTAPRHVLEAAFAFGGDRVEIAERIIQRRRETPFTNIGELRKELFEYSDSIKKCEKYITMKSTFFTIKVTARSGIAKASVIIGLIKDDKGIQRVAVLSG